MGVDEIKKEILAEAHDQAMKTQGEGKEEEQKLLDDAKQRREQIIKQAREEAEQMIANKRKERAAALRLKMKALISEARGEAVDAALLSVWEEFSKVREGQGYAKLLESIIHQGVKEMGSGSVVYVNKDDLKLARRIKGAKVSGSTIDSLGGAVVTSSDGRVRIDNTFESNFEEKRDEVIKQIYDLLFKKEK